MSIFNDKILKSVAEAASKVMQQEELKGKQHEIDANKNGKIDAHDFKLLRAKKVMKEEVEQLDEAFPTVADAKKRMAAGKTTTGTVSKTSTGLVHKRDYKDDDNDSDDTAKKKTPYGARQKRNMGTKLYKESFTDMISSIQNDGVKSLSKIFEAEQINEEPDNEQFTKELEDQKASMMGKKKQPSVAAPATQGVKAMAEDVDADDFISEDEEVEQLDELSNDKMKAYIKKAAETDKDLKRGDGVYRAMKKIAGVHGHVAGTNKKQNEEVELDERTLTKGEAEKKEDYVKGMKKKLSGFKERYGERAKEVMYATATKMAKED